ncbi:ribonuclease E [gut metagenome]|uniref:Ribonuclease E n=1 Tax=gut metagenome TaxID=749906 RepID=J9GCT2_9ZZZZ
MRLRDLGGLIVIDFIDMADPRNQRGVEQRLKDAMRYDRARVQMAKISRFGLMELSRQRLRPALSEGNHITCPRCNGVGVIRDTESCALQVLRILQEEAMKEGTGAIHAQVPVDVATFLLNEKRNDVMKLEARHRVPIVLIPNMHLETPHYHIERLRQDDDRLEDTTASFKRVEEIEETKADDPYALKSNEDKPVRPKQVPVIKNVIPREPAPVHVEADKSAPEAAPAAEQPAKKGFFARLIAFFTGDEKPVEEKPAEKAEEDKKARDEQREGDKRRSRREGRRSRRSSSERQNRHETTAEERSDEKHTRRERSARRLEETPADKEARENMEHTTRRRRSRRRPSGLKPLRKRPRRP